MTTKDIKTSDSGSSKDLDIDEMSKGDLMKVRALRIKKFETRVLFI